ncbi:MAG TPA: hypothetical protein VGR67_12250 [Candidatus Polarisedimenticolia bacterium]|nr:hypothetical protein [Candidatus Polarisedimenticolia bacterium]
MKTNGTAEMTGAGRTILHRLAREAAWVPATVLVLHAALGAILGHEPYLDPVMHLLGGAAAAFFFRHAGSAAAPLLGALTDTALDLLSFGLTCAIALGWEFAEFVVDHIFDTNVQLSLGNTMRDLFLGVTGALLYLTARSALGAARRRIAETRD